MHQTIDEASDNVLEALKDLMKFVNGTMGDIDSIAFLVSSVENAKNAVRLDKIIFLQCVGKLSECFKYKWIQRELFLQYRISSDKRSRCLLNFETVRCGAY